MKNESGQALAEYAVVMMALFTLVFITGTAVESLYDGAFLDLLSGFSMYSDNYDLVLSLPFP